jgi:hypothetical protein
MPPPTSSLKPAAGGKINGLAAVAKNGATPAAGATGGEERKFVGKPDKATYDAEQDGFNKEIAEVKTKLVSWRAELKLYAQLEVEKAVWFDSCGRVLGTRAVCCALMKVSRPLVGGAESSYEET